MRVRGNAAVRGCDGAERAVLEGPAAAYLKWTETSPIYRGKLTRGDCIERRNDFVRFDCTSGTPRCDARAQDSISVPEIATG